MYGTARECSDMLEECSKKRGDDINGYPSDTPLFIKM